MNKLKSIGMKAISIILGLYGFYMCHRCIVEDRIGMKDIFIPTLIFIAAYGIWLLSNQKSFNAASDNQKMIFDAKDINIEKMYQDFQDMKTNMGRPHLGKIKNIKEKAIIIGPDENGGYFYIYKSFGGSRILILFNQFTEFIENIEENPKYKQEKDEEMQSESYKDVLCNNFENTWMIDILYDKFDRYVKNGEIDTSWEEINKGKIYRFDEDFKLTSQKFIISDLDGNPIYEVKGKIPYKTFSIEEIKTGNEVFKITKRIFHALPQYDMYVNESKIGRFKKKINFVHDTFKMQTEDGLLTMKSVNATIGDNYRIKMEEKPIGAIAEKLNITIHNMIFDNYLIYVREEKYTPLVMAMGVMAAREAQRDRNQIASYDDEE